MTAVQIICTYEYNQEHKTRWSLCILPKFHFQPLLCTAILE